MVEPFRIDTRSARREKALFVRLSKEERAGVAVLSRRHRMTMSEVVRQMVSYCLRQKKGSAA